MEPDKLLVLSPAILVVISVLKSALPRKEDGSSIIKNYIPALAVVMGAVFYPLLFKPAEGGEASLLWEVLKGIVYGAGAVGLRELGTKTVQSVSGNKVPLILISFFCLSLVGCGHLLEDGERIPPTQETVDRASASIELVAHTGVYLLVKDDPELASYFRQASTLIDDALEDDILDPRDIGPIIDEFILEGEGSPEAALALNTVMTLYDIWFSSNVRGLELDHYAFQYLKALVDGIRKGSELVVPENEPTSNPLLN